MTSPLPVIYSQPRPPASPLQSKTLLFGRSPLLFSKAVSPHKVTIRVPWEYAAKASPAWLKSLGSRRRSGGSHVTGHGQVGILQGTIQRGAKFADRHRAV